MCLLFILAGKNDAFSQDKEIEGYDSIADRVLLKKELTGGITIHVLGNGFEFPKRGQQDLFQFPYF